MAYDTIPVGFPVTALKAEVTLMVDSDRLRLGSVGWL
jgi:hypothetical protein